VTSRIARSLLAVLVAAAVFVALGLLALLLGATECDRGECNWFGEFIDDTRPLYFVLSLAAGIGLGLATARPGRH